MNNLVQVDDDAWIDPSTVTGVKHWPERYEEGLKRTIPDNTVISHAGDRYTISHWPFERVQYALGLIDKTWLHEIWERT